MKRGEFVINLANKIVRQLRPYSKRIEIVGSIRRKSKEPHDIDIVLIPKDKKNKEVFHLSKSSTLKGTRRFEDKNKLEEKMRKLGKFVQGGEHESTWRIEGIKVELYYTNEEEFGAALLAYSGKKGSNIGLRIIARLKGLKLNNHGLFNRKTGKRIAGKTEREIYSALNRPYKEPWER